MANGRSITTQAIYATFNTPENFNKTLSSAADAEDVITLTPVRIAQVLSNAFANQTNSDASNSDSLFNRVMYQDPAHTEMGLTQEGYTFVELSFLPIFYGVIRRIYQVRREKELGTYRFLKRRLNQMSQELGSEKKFKKSEIMDEFEHLLKSGEMPLFQQPNHAVQSDDEHYFEPNRLIKMINRLREHPIAKKLGSVWDFLSTESLFFWVVGFPITLFAGAASASYMPLVLTIVASLGGAILLYKFGYFIYEKIKTKSAFFKSKDADREKEQSVEDPSQLDRLKQYYFMQAEHHQLMETLHKEYHVNIPISENDIDSDIDEINLGDNAYYIDRKSKETIRIMRKKSSIHSFTKTAMTYPISVKQSPKKTLRSPLGQYLLGTSKERKAQLAVSTLAALVSGFVITVFILWLGTVAAATLPFVGAAGVAAVLGNMNVTVAASSVMGALFGVTTFCKCRTEQLAYERKVHNVLSTEYQPGITNLDKFKTLHVSIEKKKAQVERLRNELKNLGRNNDEDLISKFDLKKINVFNDYYFENQTHQPSAMTWLKKGLNRAYSLIGGGQTGVFLTRMLFLAGGIAAGSIAGFATGALIPFLILAATAGIVMGVLRLSQYQMERNQKHREAFLDHLPARIRHLEIKEKELAAVISKLKENKQHALNAPIHQLKPQRQQPKILNEMEIRHRKRIAKYKKQNLLFSKSEERTLLSPQDRSQNDLIDTKSFIINQDDPLYISLERNRSFIGSRS